MLFTANDAYMRDLKIFAPADCIVSNTEQENRQALRQLATVLKGNISASSLLRFRRRARPLQRPKRTPSDRVLQRQTPGGAR